MLSLTLSLITTLIITVNPANTGLGKILFGEMGGDQWKGEWKGE